MTVNTASTATPPGTARDEGRKRTTRHPGGGSSRWGLALLIVAVGLFVQTQASNFLTSNNIETIILNVSSMMIAAAAAMRLLVAGNVDLSIGGQFSLISVVTALVARDTHSAPIAVAVALGLGTAIGLAQRGGGPVAQHLPADRHPRGVVRLLRVGQRRLALASRVRLPELLPRDRAQQAGGRPDSGVDRAPLLRSVRPVADPDDPRASGDSRSEAIPAACRSEGINVNRAALDGLRVHGLHDGCHRCAFDLFADPRSGTPDIGVNFKLETLTAVIVGGVAFNGGSGRPLGVFLGVVLLGTIDAAMVFLGFADYYQQIAKGAILILALAADQCAGTTPRMKTSLASSRRVGSGPTTEMTVTTRGREGPATRHSLRRHARVSRRRRLQELRGRAGSAGRQLRRPVRRGHVLAR